MKKLIVLLAWVLGASTLTYAQQSDDAERAASRQAEKARQKAEAEAADELAYRQAVQALKDKQFVLEADQVIFRNGHNAFVSSTTNFVLMNDQRSTVQVAFNTPYPGPNGIGGVTVDGTASDMKITTNKRGNVNCSFNVQGIGISAQIFISLTNGGNKATVTVNPNFNNNTLTLSGVLVPLSQSDVYKGRAW